MILLAMDRFDRISWAEAVFVITLSLLNFFVIALAERR